jgi:hypothetical protein
MSRAWGGDPYEHLSQQVAHIHDAHVQGVHTFHTFTTNELHGDMDVYFSCFTVAFGLLGH